MLSLFFLSHTFNNFILYKDAVRYKNTLRSRNQFGYPNNRCVLFGNLRIPVDMFFNWWMFFIKNHLEGYCKWCNIIRNYSDAKQLSKIESSVIIKFDVNFIWTFQFKICECIWGYSWPRHHRLLFLDGKLNQNFVLKCVKLWILSLNNRFIDISYLKRINICASLLALQRGIVE